MGLWDFRGFYPPYTYLCSFSNKEANNAKVYVDRSDIHHALHPFGLWAHTYTVELKDGREYVSDGEPDVNAYDWVSFKTTAGKKVRIKLDEVSVIREN